MSIEAMKMALKFCEDIGEFGGPYPYVNETTIVSDSRKLSAALRQAIEQAEKPWVKSYCNYCTPVDAVNMKQERVDETPKGEHKPVGYINGFHGGYIVLVFTPLNPSAVYLDGTTIYTAPPKREWVGLTDEEMNMWEQKSQIALRWAEKLLKEKNGG